MTAALVLVPVLRGAAMPRTPQARRDEACQLARAIGLEIADSPILPVTKINPSLYIGTGQAELLADTVRSHAAALVIVDTALSPIQQRNLEKALQCKVIDRTGLILEIFGARARTHEGKLQVELAALQYQKSRLVRSWTHLERQRGGSGFLGGPGESQKELDRRMLASRIDKIRRDLADVRRTRGIQRAARQNVPYPVVALVGYTNAGKSTLFNRLTGASVQAQDMLFATLDPTMRVIPLNTASKVILSDTVGFVADLPTTLVAAFHATLEEVLEADVLVHVRDIAHPDSDQQKTDVLQVLRSVGLGEDFLATQVLEGWNKTDLLDDEHRQKLLTHEENRRVLPFSALTGEGIPALLTAIENHLTASYLPVETVVPTTSSETLAWLHRHGRVLHQELDEDGGQWRVSARLSQRYWQQWQERKAAFTGN